MKSDYATVDEVIAILRKESATGRGDYSVICNGEYYLARKDEVPIVTNSQKEISLGGYYE